MTHIDPLTVLNEILMSDSIRQHIQFTNKEINALASTCKRLENRKGVREKISEFSPLKGARENGISGT